MVSRLASEEVSVGLLEEELTALVLRHTCPRIATSAEHRGAGLL